MSDPRQRAQTAYTMGNLGLWSQLRRDDADDYADDEDYGSGLTQLNAVERGSWWDRTRGRVLRWGLAAGVVLAYVNHWPGGH